MNRFPLLGAILLTLAGILFLLGTRYLPSTTFSEQPAWVNPYQIERSAVIVNERPYTLNYVQHKTLLEGLNTATPVKDKTTTAASLPFSAIILYPFQGSPIVLKPTALQERNLVFQTPTWNQGRELLELSGGVVYETLLQSFDHAQVPTYP